MWGKFNFWFWKNQPSCIKVLSKIFENKSGIHNIQPTCYENTKFIETNSQ